MDYQRLYDELIAFRKANPATGYTENHHILMTSMGGSDNKENLVRLTGREHWIAHLYLYKIHRNSQTAHACHMMAMRCEERGIPRVRNSRMYEMVRKECARLTGIKNSNLIGSRNSQFGTRWICNIELRENEKISKEEEIPNGWILGRNRWRKLAKITEQKKEKPSKVVKIFHKRLRLDHIICITDGISNRKLYFHDQMPIPTGWKFGITLSEEIRKRVSDGVSISNKRRIGAKYAPRKNNIL